MSRWTLLSRETILPPEICARIDQDLLFMHLRPDEQTVCVVISLEPEGATWPAGLNEPVWVRITREAADHRFEGVLLRGSRLVEEMEAGERLSFGLDEIYCVAPGDPLPGPVREDRRPPQKAESEVFTYAGAGGSPR